MCQQGTTQTTRRETETTILIGCVPMRGDVVYIQERVSQYIKNLEAYRTRSDVAMSSG